MKRSNQKNLILLAILCFLAACNSTQKEEARVTKDFNFDWEFYLEDDENQNKDALWQPVRLPHDWSVEHSFTQENTSGATAFLPGGIGWYKKEFTLPKNAKNKTTWIEFDGVYSNSEVWINNNYLGKRPYGYIPFKYNLTQYLKYGETNEIKVKVDRSAYIDCRWYPGSGIYRNVKLVTTNKLHIPQWGTFITSNKVDKKEALIAINTAIKNEATIHKKATLKTTIFYDGNEVSSTASKISSDKNSSKYIQQEIKITNPNIWDVEHPNLYTVTSEIILNDQIIDRKETVFGIRSFSFDKNKGFFLNGKNLKIKGVCLHHDAGLVGAAVPIGVWQRRLATLKKAGINAIRTAHNPPSEEFLDLCDKMGFLVQDEAFDEFNNPKDKKHNYNQQKADPLTAGYTNHFTEWSERDLKNMVLRDRNHPSIIMWSIGNEIEWTYPNYGKSTGYWGANKVGDVNYYYDEPPLSVEKIKANFTKEKQGEYNLAATAKKLSKWVKEIDTTRPVTANLVIPTVSNFSGYADVLDLVGLSYRQAVYDYSHRNYPNKTFIGTENWAKYHEWKAIENKDYISGIFLWTGIDYMGESRNWPKKGSGSGLLDFAGFKKPAYHMFKTLWNDESHIYITTQTQEKSPYKFDIKSGKVVEKEKGWSKKQKWGWQDVNEHWNYKKGDKIAVEVYTNESEIELFLDDKSLGIQKLKDVEDHILKWIVPYSEGNLVAKAVNFSNKTSISTAKEFNMLSLKADTKEINANGYDVIHFTVQLKDKNGNLIKHQDQEIEFIIDGNVKLLGVDNGSSTNIQDYQSNKIITSKGKALLILQANFEASSIKVKAVSKKIESETIEINIK
ncbi:threonine synthase [Polaribacter reichenbachii]|uniref:Threonine synthase n=1 Tax=Polaribacter reichenbachii TaxID=996801 RepID=A0A1B8TV98_9FLAO|nr:glycoside hydrolase family 2 TIM barrel-domain containing protein [Polaribacter reichenbachii]APZ45485.1 threonine synthase [Polaribacter reichenbachii]AUC19346.1 threonine synthase [Polaribacter reichenbachii]OBY63500.1 threonine synthase [Polaribacter reichenbachii]